MTIGDDVRRGGRRAGPRPLRRPARRPERAAPPLPGRQHEGLGLQGDRVPDSRRHGVRVAERRRRRLRRSASARSAQGVRGGARRALLARSGRCDVYGVVVHDDMSGWDEAGHARPGGRELPDRHRRRRHLHRLLRARRRTTSASCTRRARRPTTRRSRWSQGSSEIARQLGSELRAFVGDVDVIVHGTTVTTNAVLTQRGARTGLLATKGFRDVLALRDGTREAPYDNRLQPPDPARAALPPPRHRRAHRLQGRRGRAARRGRCRDRRGDASAARRSRRSRSPSCTRRRTRRTSDARSSFCAALLPGVYLTASSELLPQVRYYARTSTTVLNAYVGPIITPLPRGPDAAPRRGGGSAACSWSCSRTAASRRRPRSPAARPCPSSRAPLPGRPPGLRQLEPHGLRDCITIDMGGTSFDAALVKDGEPLVMTDGVVDRWRLGAADDRHPHDRRRRRIDRSGRRGRAAPRRPAERRRRARAGLLRPRRRRADHDRRRSRARLPRPGDVPARRDAARPRGVGVGDPRANRRAARPVARGGRSRRLRPRQRHDGRWRPRDQRARGLDPRDFPLVVAGGAGPLHAAEIARELEIPLLVVPRESSIFCAAGMLMCDFKHDFVRPLKTPLADADRTRSRRCSTRSARRPARC